MQAGHSRRQPPAAKSVGCAAIAAETVPPVPVEQALGLTQQAIDFGRHGVFDRHGAQVMDEQVVASGDKKLPRIDQPALIGDILDQHGLVIEKLGEIGNALVRAEQGAFACCADCLGLCAGEKRIIAVGLAFQHRPVAANDQKTAGSGIHQPVEEIGIFAPVGQPVERIDRVTCGKGKLCWRVLGHYEGLSPHLDSAIAAIVRCGRQLGKVEKCY